MYLMVPEKNRILKASSTKVLFSIGSFEGSFRLEASRIEQSLWCHLFRFLQNSLNEKNCSPLKACRWNLEKIFSLKTEELENRICNLCQR